MKITSVRAVAHAAPAPDMRGDGRNYCYVKVETDAGLHGWGEASCGTLAVIPMVEELGRMLVGQDPSAIEHIWQRLYNCQHNIRGGIVHMAALSGIDVALWDLKGKALGVPVYQLLGGATRERLWCYSRFDGATPEAAADHARREAGRGFTALKGDPFAAWGPQLSSEAIEAAVRIVAAVREAVGPRVELLIEAHGRLDVRSAVRFLDATRDLNIFFIEEPLPPEDIDGLLEIRRHTTVSIASGERLLTKWAAAPLIERRAIDIIQPDPAHAGGITEVRKIAVLAEAHHVWVQPHNPYGPVNTLAAAHLNAVLPNFITMELIMEEDMHNWFGQIIKGGRAQEPVAGHFPLPEGPGLGIDLDEAALAALPPAIEQHPSSYLRRARFPSRQGIDWA